MHLYDNIGDALLSLQGSTSSSNSEFPFSNLFVVYFLGSNWLLVSVSGLGDEHQQGSQ